METKRSLRSGLLNEAQKRAARDKKIQQFIIIFGGLLSLCAIFSDKLCYFWNSFAECSIFIPMAVVMLALLIILWFALPLGRVSQGRVDCSIARIITERLDKCYENGPFAKSEELRPLAEDFRNLA